MWWVVIGKWKSNINSGSKWKPIRNLSHQQFVKILLYKIICDCSITQKLWQNLGTLS